MSRVVRLAFRSTLPSGALCVNTLCVKSDPEGPDILDATLQEIVDECATWLVTPYRAMLNNGITLHELVAEELTGGADETAVHPLEVAGTKPAGTGYLPEALCAVISWRTARATKRGRGRMFVPGPMDSSDLPANDAWLTGAGTWYQKMVDFAGVVLAGHDYSPGSVGQPAHLSGVIWSRLDDAERDITAFRVQTRPHWLRSRMTAP